MIEKELKCIIDESAFENIKKYYKWEKVIVQENYYYTDTKGILGKERATFRIRVIDGIPKVQVKLHKNKTSALQISEETEFSIESVPQKISALDANKYTGLDCGELVLLGSLVTERYVLNREGTELCLDKNTYLGKTDYEVELEYIDECSKSLLDELCDRGVEFTKKCTGKYSRFVKVFSNLIK